MIRLVSWNVAGRIARLEEQVASLARRRPDIVALQEVTAKSAPRLVGGLASAGLPYAITSFELAPRPSLLIGRRRYGELLASRWPLSALPPSEFGVPWPERVLSALVDGPTAPIELHTTHIPCGASKPAEMKIHTLRGIYKRLARPSSRPRILCGDFNTPQAERTDGTVITWGQHELREKVITHYPWWDRGERCVLVDLARFDLADVYRTLHGYRGAGFSWTLRRKGRWIARRRFDHVFASASLHALACRYLHPLRLNGLSDHAPIEVEFGASR